MPRYTLLSTLSKKSSKRIFLLKHNITSLGVKKGHNFFKVTAMQTALLVSIMFFSVSANAAVDDEFPGSALGAQWNVQDVAEGNLNYGVADDLHKITDGGTCGGWCGKDFRVNVSYSGNFGAGGTLIGRRDRDARVRCPKGILDAVGRVRCARLAATRERAGGPLRARGGLGRRQGDLHC